MMETDIAVASSLKITCSRDDLVTRLGAVSRVVSSRGTVQVLAGVLLRAQAGALELAATDMELSLRTTLPASVEGEGAVVVPGKLLVDLARLLPAADVTIEYRPDEGVTTVSSGSYTSRLNVYAAEDFPRLPAIDVPLHAVATPSLLDTVDRVSRSASRDESRPVLTGIQVRFEGTRLIMAATDSYRLSFKETELQEAGPELEAIIPARALTELARLAAGTETVQLGANENTVVFGAGDSWLTTRRIDGQFPDVNRLLPESFEVEVELPRVEFRDVVRRAAVMAQRNAPLRLRFADGELTVSAQSQDVGETRESIPVAYSREPLEIGFNAEFLADGVDSVSGDTVRLKLINPLRPGLISADGDAFWYLIMPIRLAG
ncbi:dnan: DNA polymerase III subunit beta [Gaiella occulta]|uniref:Beta sliding clamp n=1 Tax=Gaiella occulta TaxID=1002870 RepID=A0A7M2YVB6_9ACTN|nr:DNA polymerase III subunit beta [Gaiella occulta]RDI74081.1 dnan: DNA polymerase III subunit beta [Gaiella occulta]